MRERKYIDLKLAVISIDENESQTEQILKWNLREDLSLGFNFQVKVVEYVRLSHMCRSSSILGKEFVMLKKSSKSEDS